MKIFNIRICLICAGVALTWLSMLLLRFIGYPISIPILAMLMGGSVVGIAYQLERRLPEGHSALLFKMVFIPIGFVAAYSIVLEQWVLSIAVVVILALVYFGCRAWTPQSANGAPLELKKKLEECCD